MKWIECNLNELGFVGRGRSRHRPRNAPQLYGGAYPFVQTGDVKAAGLHIIQHEQTYSDEGLAQSKMWPEGTLCITIAANIAETALLGFDACFPDSVVGFLADNAKCDARFIKYLFDCKRLQYQQVAHGATQDNLSLEKLLSFSVCVPQSVDDQQRIASVLSAYDDLIENNLRRIKLLEESARLLYREWFLRLRFPGHEHTRIVDGVPERWERHFVPDVIDVNPKTPVPSNMEDIRYVPMSALSVSGMVVDLDMIETREKATGAKFRNNDVLLPRITPCLENGKTASVSFLADDEVACGSTEFIVLRGTRVSPEFAYCLARSYSFRENAIKSMVGSSGRQRAQTSCFDDFPVLLPPSVLQDEFRNAAAPCFRQVSILVQQNQKLRQTRDILLQKLMNGEIAA